jgi:hypothetical protein
MTLRHLRSLFVFIVLGSVANVGVAWYLAATPISAVSKRQNGDDLGIYMGPSGIQGWGRNCIFVERAPGRVSVEVSSCPTCGVGASLYRRLDGPQDTLVPTWSCVRDPQFLSETLVSYPMFAQVEEYASGWPLHALSRSCIVVRELQLNQGGQIVVQKVNYYEEVGCVHLPPDLAQQFQTPMFPARPLVVGFALNSLCYGAGFWFVIAMPRGARRYWRSKRGLCPACAYPIGTSAVCTECGKPVSPRAS